MGSADAGEKKAQVIVDLRDGSHRGARILGGGALLDGDGRREPLDGLHVRLVHLSDELAGIGRQGLHVAPLALRVDRVEGEGGFPRAAHPRDDDQPVPGDVQADVPEVVLGSSLDPNDLHGPI